MRVEKIESLNLQELHAIMTSNKISEHDKAHFVQLNQHQIKDIMKYHMTAAEFQGMMNGRELVKFRPLLNSFRKRGDKKLLAEALEIDPGDVDDYLNEVTNDIQEIDDMRFLPKDKVEKLKTYVYRHGSKDKLVTFFEYELTTAKDKLKTLYSTLEYHSGGVADYFIRPIHRFDNKTLVKIYNVIDKNLKTATESGEISQADKDKAAIWALIQIYKIQNNNKLINAIKTYKTLRA